MSYICCVDSARPEPLFFEGEKAEQFRDKLPDDPDSPLPPSPNLRRNQVVHGNAVPLHLACDAEVEIGTVCQQGSNRRMLCCVPAKATILAVDARQMADNLGKADDSQARGINDRLDARRLKPRSGTTIEP